MTITWQVVVALGMILAFLFAVLWLYRPKENKEQESKSDNKAVESNEKQLGGLQDLLYKHLQARVYIEKVDKDGHKYKEYNEANDEKYISALENAINELKAKVKNDSKETQSNASKV